MAARSALAGVPLCGCVSKQVSRLPGRTYRRSLWFVLALRPGVRWSGAEYSKSMGRLSLPGPEKWELEQAEVSEPLQRWCRLHLLSAPSSNVACVGLQEPGLGSVMGSSALASPAILAALLQIFPLSAAIAAVLRV